MLKRPIISFVLALLATSIVISLVIITVGLLTFNLAGGETLDQVEGENVRNITISIVLLLVAFAFAKSYFKIGNKSAGYGIIIVPTLLVVAMTIYFVKEDVYTSKFDKVIWKQAEFKPEGMAKTLIRKKKLIGLTRLQVKEMLGAGSEEYGDANSDRGAIVYAVENDWTLHVHFENDKVVEVEMRRPAMMTKRCLQQEVWGYPLADS